MTTDATHAGALQEDETVKDQEEKPLSPREQAMALMETQRDAQLMKEAGIEPEQSAGTVEEQKPVEAEPMHKIKIDGEEMELPLSEIVKGYQKDKSASRRMEDAAKRARELDEREETLKQAEEQLKRQTIKPAEKETTVDDDDAEIDAALDAYLEGDRDPFKAIIKSAKQGRQEPVPDEEIDRRVAAILAKRKQDEDHASANSQFAKDHPDILQDAFLLDMANKRYYAKIDEGKSIVEAMAEAGRETKEWLQAKTGNRNADKQRRKETIDNLQVAGARSSAPETDDTPENPSSIISEMRQKRGLAA